MTKTVLVCLHGWGGSKESFTELREALKGTEIEIFTPDLPGFGAEPEPETSWTNDDYADWVETYIHSQFQIPNSKFFLLGHSHGGRIAVKLALRGTIHIDHLFLCAPAGIRHGRHFKRMAGLILAKTGKKVMGAAGLKKHSEAARRFLYKLVRVHDYEKASPRMQQTLLNVTREDFRPLVHGVNIPTDIFWGTDDGMTPVSDAKIFHRDIAGSELHIYEGVRHGVHRDKAKEIAAVITTRLHQ
jgi:pimeloyl-ACP methyl ester carboxylesterase